MIVRVRVRFVDLVSSPRSVVSLEAIVRVVVAAAVTVGVRFVRMNMAIMLSRIVVCLMFTPIYN